MSFLGNRIVIAIAALLLGCAVTVLYFTYDGVSPVYSLANDQRHTVGKYTNPLLECAELPEELTIGKRAEIESRITDYVSSALTIGTISEASVYFRDLNNGPWFGINERAAFTPGSLLKLPLAVSFYRRAQSDPELFNTTIELDREAEDRNEEEVFGSGTRLTAGTYTVRELIELMLVESNNDAAEILAQYAGAEQVLGIYTDFGIEPPRFGSDYEINAKTFGAFFRVLFNASYVPQAASEEILEHLTHSTFKDGIVAGVPTTVPVAHKFGIRTIPGREVQLHDCGIVYVPETPYVLCVMTRAHSEEAVAQFIAEVSRRVYEEIVHE